MKVRSLVAIAGLVTLTAAPMIAHSNGADKAADACIQAFVDTYLPKNRPVTVRKVSSVPGPVDHHARRHTLDLSARVGNDGKQLATARCVANDAGEIIVLEGTAPAGQVAENGFAPGLK